MRSRIIMNSPSVRGERLSLPRIGSVKVGYKDEKGFPRSVDYFIPSGKYAGLFAKAYGDKPSTIQIMFPDDDPGKVCRERFEYRDDEGKLVAYGDGEVFSVWDGKEYKELNTEDYPNVMRSVEKRYPNRLFRKNGDGWTIILAINFIVPLVCGIAGVWQFTTHGTASTIPAVRDIFDEILERRGSIKNVLFDLSVEFAKSQKPGDKSRYPVVRLVPNESEENVQKIKQAYKSLGFNQPKLNELKE